MSKTFLRLLYGPVRGSVLKVVPHHDQLRSGIHSLKEVQSLVMSSLHIVALKETRMLISTHIVLMTVFCVFRKDLWKYDNIALNLFVQSGSNIIGCAAIIHSFSYGCKAKRAFLIVVKKTVLPIKLHRNENQSSLPLCSLQKSHFFCICLVFANICTPFWAMMLARFLVLIR